MLTKNLLGLPTTIETPGLHISHSVEITDDISRDRDTPPQLSLLARILVSQVDSYNGHSQLEVRDKLSLEEITSLLGELTAYYTCICINWSVYCVMESDGSGSFHIRDYWDDDNPGKVKGEKDKLLFSFGGV